MGFEQRLFLVMLVLTVLGFHSSVWHAVSLMLLGCCSQLPISASPSQAYLYTAQDTSHHSSSQFHAEAADLMLRVIGIAFQHHLACAAYECL